jgi:hypothetical protein
VFVKAAIKAGFRRAHTAPGKHRKQEQLVGKGLREVYYGNVKRKHVHVRTKLDPHGALRSFYAGTNQIHAEKEGTLFIKPYVRESPLRKTGQSRGRVLTFESAAPRGREPQRRLRRLYAPTHAQVYSKRNRANLAYTRILRPPSNTHTRSFARSLQGSRKSMEHVGHQTICRPEPLRSTRVI